MRFPSWLRHTLSGLALVGLVVPWAGCVDDIGAAGDYCRRTNQCDEGLICVELMCRRPFDPRPDSGPREEPDLGPPPEDMGPEDMGPDDMGPDDMGPEDMGPGDMGPEDMGPEDMGPDDMGPEDMGPEDMGP